MPVCALIPSGGWSDEEIKEDFSVLQYWRPFDVHGQVGACCFQLHRLAGPNSPDMLQINKPAPLGIHAPGDRVIDPTDVNLIGQTDD